MRIFKRIAIFLAVNLLVCALMNFVLTDPSVVRIYLDDIHENQYDTLIIGTSHGETGFDPMMMSEAMGTKVFNASRRLMTVPDIYYLLRAANRDHQLHTVYYELDPSYWNLIASAKTHDDTCMLRHAPLFDRIDYAARYLFDENYNFTLFPYNFDAKTIRKAPAIVKAKLSLRGLSPDDQIRTIYRHLNISENFDYLGRGFRYGRSADPAGFAQYEPFLFTEDLISDDYLDAFDRMTRYCRKEGIRLVCVASALPPQRLQQENHAQAHAYFAQLCADSGVEFYDMNALKSGLLDRGPEDYTDIDGHMMGPLAQRQTQLLIDIEQSDDKRAFFDCSCGI